MSTTRSLKESLGFGRLLRQWRQTRGMNQLALATDAEISIRHLSFLETGRAQPSRAMVERLSAALDVPLVHFSVYWWRTLHQPPSLMKPGPGTMPDVIVAALLVNFAAFSLLYVYFVAKRVRLLRREAEAAG